jgi:DNA-binding transcriptional LysR family regulator
MEIKHLKTFAIAAKTGNFAKAAKQLYYAPSTVTAQIKLLEDELNIKLFDRLGKQVRLSRAGKTLAVYAQQILKLTEEAVNATCGTSTQGAIAIGISESLAVIRMPEVFASYRQQFPQSEIELKFGPCSDFKDLLRKNIIDVAILVDREISDPDLIVEATYPETMFILCAPDHHLAQKQGGIGPADLANVNLISENGCDYRRLLEEMLEEVGAQFRSVMAVSSLQAERQFTASGLGVCLLAGTAVEENLQQKKLVALPWAGPDFRIAVQIVYHKNKWISPALRAFIDLARRKLERQEARIP